MFKTFLIYVFMKAIEYLSSVFADILVRKIESFEGKYKTSWIKLKGFRPRNLRGNV